MIEIDHKESDNSNTNHSGLITAVSMDAIYFYHNNDCYCPANLMNYNVMRS